MLETVSGTGKFKNKKWKPCDDVQCRQVLVAAPSVKFSNNFSSVDFAVIWTDGQADTMRQIIFRDDFLLMCPMKKYYYY